MDVECYRKGGKVSKLKQKQKQKQHQTVNVYVGKQKAAPRKTHARKPQRVMGPTFAMHDSGFQRLAMPYSHLLHQQPIPQAQAQPISQQFAVQPPGVISFSTPIQRESIAEVKPEIASSTIAVIPGELHESKEPVEEPVTEPVHENPILEERAVTSAVAASVSANTRSRLGPLYDYEDAVNAVHEGKGGHDQRKKILDDILYKVTGSRMNPNTLLKTSIPDLKENILKIIRKRRGD